MSSKMPVKVIAFLSIFCAAASLRAAGGAKPLKVIATDVVRKTIYHSPQTPGYTCWAETWLMPDGRIMVAFVQATGPLEGRPRTRRDVLKKLNWALGEKPEEVKYDMAGTSLELIYLASKDGGNTWEKVSADPGATPMNTWVQGQRGLADGAIVRTVWGQYLPFYDVPHTGYLQWSRDGAKTWGAPLVFDTASGQTWPRRLRVLRDGRMALAGGFVSKVATGETRDSVAERLQPALWVSDDQGQHWSPPLVVWNGKTGNGECEEWDFAELPDGDLLGVIRADTSGHRWQTLLKKNGNTWIAQPTQELWIPHSGQPDVLMTSEGIVLHLAQDGTAWTADKGATWTYLEGNPRTQYYPSSVQLPDGRIFCVGHAGGDDYYIRKDQRIEAITFRLKVEK
jgi:hypothetical protein